MHEVASAKLATWVHKQKRSEVQFAGGHIPISGGSAQSKAESAGNTALIWPILKLQHLLFWALVAPKRK